MSARGQPVSQDPPIAQRQAGYAVLAAVTCAAALACIALELVAENKGEGQQMAARFEQARLVAAADAGIDLALHGLAIGDPVSRWSIDGVARQVDFEGTELTIVVEDERGKAPLNSLDDDQARGLFAGAGASGDRLDALVREFREWQTQDDGDGDDPAPPRARPIRHAPFRNVDELIGLRDMDPALLARIKPAATVFFEDSGPFDPDHARPLAVEAMRSDTAAADESGEGQASPDPPSEQPVEKIEDDRLIGRALTVRVTALARDGARTSRMAIVELTGDKKHPYYVRYVE